MPRYIWFVIVNMLLLFSIMSVFGLKVNISDSYPLGIYKRVKGKHELHSLVESCLPDSVSTRMVERSYIPATGNCGGYPAVIKQIFAIEGDIVVVEDDVAVNGTSIPKSTLLEKDHLNRRLIPALSTTISSEHLWLMSNRIANSYDARYFGETPSKLVVSNLVPVWTLD